MSVLWSVLAGIGTVLLFLLKGVGILLLVVLLVLLGFFPQPILDTSHAAMSNIQQWFVNSVSTTRP